VISSCTILHYGKEWLAWSLRSVADVVDKMYVVYSPTPSMGSTTTLQCPDTRNELMDIAADCGAYWNDCPEHYGAEWQHRAYAMGLCEKLGSNLIVILDADEVWDPFDLEYAIKFVEAEQMGSKYRVGMRHFWRSTKWVCDDQAQPERFVKIGDSLRKDSYSYIPSIIKPYHFGYAQSPALVNYKMEIHGHKSEIRPGWYDNIFLPWKPGDKDVHPTNKDNWWEPKPYIDTEGKLEFLIGDHPYWNKDIIE